MEQRKEARNGRFKAELAQVVMERSNVARLLLAYFAEKRCG